jgi:hypothetical protein
MKMSENSQAQDLLPMELPLTSSRAGSHAKTYQLPAISGGLTRELVQGCGQKSFVSLASYDPNSSLWRTSQICLEALVSGQAGGLAEFSVTWPNAGMMRNGETYQLGQLDCLTAESVSGLLPTPLKSDLQASFSKATVRKVMKRAKQEHLCYRPIMMGWDRLMTVTLYERVMGFPPLWVASMLSETP